MILLLWFCSLVEPGCDGVNCLSVAWNRCQCEHSICSTAHLRRDYFNDLHWTPPHVSFLPHFSPLFVSTPYQPLTTSALTNRLSSMLCFSHPPMFTSDGYQPSIFMDISPSHTCPDRHPGQRPEEVSNSSSEGHITACRVDYIQIWLNTHSHESGQDTAPGFATDNTPPISAVAQGTSLRIHAGDMDPSQEDDPMEWESCVSSFAPTMRPIPEPNQRCLSVSPEPHAPTSDCPAVQASNLPVSFALHKRMMLPVLPFQGRARCIFLASESSADPRMHRSVNGLLHNTAVQRICSWFKTTIESCALEQWRNLSLWNHFSELAAIATAPTSVLSSSGSDGDRTVPKSHDCPICFKSGVIMKVIVACGHGICWKCEQHLNQTGNISCPMCRRIRLASSYKNVRDMFRTTIGVHSHDYTHSYCPNPCADTSTGFGLDENEDDDEIEHELSDRYLWESSASFLEYLQSSRHHSVNQYFLLNAAQDLCTKSSTEEHLPEYNDQAILEPPMSGLVLPPHRLYITLIHFCLDMLTLPNPTEFQRKPEFKREAMLLELVILFLVPTDEFSPRHVDRIYNAPAWIEQGQYILARIYRFMQTKMRQNIVELNRENDQQAATQQNPQQTEAPARNHVPIISIPSTPIPEHILYLGTARWMWIAQSLTVLLTWIQAADLNPSMEAPTTRWMSASILGKRSLRRNGDSLPAKRRCLSREFVENNDHNDDDDDDDDNDEMFEH